jgi:phosphatidylserine/phosphatidylglycerophosphate/cardiolipin synthase-like enzyme
VSEKVVRLLSNASPSVLKAVSKAADGLESLQVLSELALNSADRMTLRSLIVECRKYGFDFARGVATGMLASEGKSEFQLVISSPFASDERKTAGVLAELIGRAQHNVSICSYVLVYLDELLPLFSAARDRGVSIRILLDNEAGRAKSASNTTASLCSIIGQDSVRFWRGESIGDASLHAKFLIADDTVLVTSANMTGRAITRNVEVGCLIETRDVVERLSELFDTLWKSSVTQA